MSLLAECLDRGELENHQFEMDSEKPSFINSLNDASDESSKDFSMLNSSGSEDSKSSDDAQLESLKQIKSHPNLLNCLKNSYMSSKIEKSISMVSDLLEEYPDDKLIIVSQWTSVLSIIGSNLKKRNITFCEIKGTKNKTYLY
jgi:SNF2 family DNA or RNA helicase